MKNSFIRIIFTLGMFFTFGNVHSQGSFSQDLHDEFNEFRNEIINEYIDFIGQIWQEYKITYGDPYYSIPKPVSPIISKDSVLPVKETLLPVNKLQEEEYSSYEELKPKVETDDTETFTTRTSDIRFFGAILKVRYENSFVKLSSVKEKGVVNLWKSLKDVKYDQLVKDMLFYKQKMQMNDWAYIQLGWELVKQLSILKDDTSRTAFLHYLLFRSGYDVQVGRVNNFLVLLIPIQQRVFRQPVITIDNKNYYIFSMNEMEQNVSVFTYTVPRDYDAGKTTSLLIQKPLLLPDLPKQFSIEAEGIKIAGHVSVNKINFFNTYPSCDFVVHARARMDAYFHNRLMNEFKPYLAGKQPIDKLSLLLGWTQKGFAYKKDGEQFGHERAFFVEENFFYPFNDCEDRAILFAYLVRHLLKMDVVLLKYSNHVATAVYTGTETPGDKVQINNRKYLVCDPTYINASIGRSMSGYENERPEVIRIN